MKNAKRLLAVQQILRQYSDETHPLSTAQIQYYLESEYNICDSYRKSINGDIQTLREHTDLEIIYRHKHGYYCLPSPFSQAETKIIFDAVASLKGLSPLFWQQFIKKFTNFFSTYELHRLQQLTIPYKHQKTSFLYHFEILLSSCIEHKKVNVTHHRKQEEICPVFFERIHDQYYLLYCYPTKKKIYRLRFQNIQAVALSDDDFQPLFTKEEILRNIEETHEAFHGTPMRIELHLLQESEVLKSWLQDDFPQIEFYRQKAVFRSSSSPRLLANLAAYHNAIEIISPQELRQEYINYLQDILHIYQK